MTYPLGTPIYRGHGNGVATQSTTLISGSDTATGSVTTSLTSAVSPRTLQADDDVIVSLQTCTGCVRW